MGTDIHLFVERRMGPGSPWMLVAVNVRCDECEGTGQARRPDGRGGGKERCNGCQGRGRTAGYQTRCYELFGMLAGVRTRQVEPIAPPRGLPPDVSRTLRMLSRGQLPEGMTWGSVDAVYGAIGPGDHSQSWLTLAELREHERRLTTEQRTWMGTFWDDFVPQLDALGAPGDVRIVFGFDS